MKSLHRPFHQFILWNYSKRIHECKIFPQGNFPEYSKIFFSIKVVSMLERYPIFFASINWVMNNCVSHSAVMAKSEPVNQGFLTQFLKKTLNLRRNIWSNYCKNCWRNSWRTSCRKGWAGNLRYILEEINGEIAEDIHEL